MVLTECVECGKTLDSSEKGMSCNKCRGINVNEVECPNCGAAILLEEDIGNCECGLNYRRRPTDRCSVEQMEIDKIALKKAQCGESRMVSASQSFCMHDPKNDCYTISDFIVPKSIGEKYMGKWMNVVVYAPIDKDEIKYQYDGSKPCPKCNDKIPYMTKWGMVVVRCDVCGRVKPENENEGETNPIVEIPCPKCRSGIPIFSQERPLNLECPNCGAKGTLK